MKMFHKSRGKTEREASGQQCLPSILHLEVLNQYKEVKRDHVLNANVKPSCHAV